MISFIQYFSKRHLVTNFIMLGIFVGGVFFWFKTSKEQMPDLTMDTVRVTVLYPGASPEEVEHFIIEPIEEKLQGIDGIYDMTSSCSQGACSVTIELEPTFPDKNTLVMDLKSAVLDVNLPDGVRDEPVFRQFKTSNRAIIDVGIINIKHRFLDYEAREELQAFARALENRLLSLPSVSEVDWNSYLDREIQVILKPEALVKYNMSVNEVLTVLKNNNVRQPAGIIKGENDAKVTVLAELKDIAVLRKLIVRGGFEGQKIKLEDIADVQPGFEDTTSIRKINGYEGVYCSIRKNSSYGIIKAIDEIKASLESFKKTNLKHSSIDIIIMDDESESVRNRLSLIGWNGALGFVLIIITLVIFLDARSAFWVAMGIPFSFCFTMVVASLMGYSINNITLAAVIIVMGMIVDDAIVVAENVARFKQSGMSEEDAVVKGTAYVFHPVFASVITTCIAFIPLLFFAGRFGKFVSFIPAIIFLMLGGSLVESMMILPSHLAIHLPPWLLRILGKGTRKNNNIPHWFHAIEDKYGKLLERLLRYKYVLVLIFVVLLSFAFYLFQAKMKYVMFPNEETTMLRLTGKAPEGTKKLKTAQMTIPIEDIFEPYIGKEVLSVMTSVSVSRWGQAAHENEFNLTIEMVPKDKRIKTANKLKEEWMEKIGSLSGFDEIKFTQSRFGQSSETPIEVMVKENNDAVRMRVAKEIHKAMVTYPALKNPEIESQLKDVEYKVGLKRDIINRLSVNPASIASTIRAAVDGITVFDFLEDTEDLYIVVSAGKEEAKNIHKILTIPVENKSGYLVPLGDVVDIVKTKTPSSIIRKNRKRKVSIYAELGEKLKKTPIEIAEYLEDTIFPAILAKNPTSAIAFEGEIKDTRESKSDFMFAIILVLFLIYAILAVLFDSLVKPLIIMLAIPFGLVGIILAFRLHGITNYGFFSVIGALGLAGVVINDSIVMLVKLDKEFDNPVYGTSIIEKIANISKTRFRAVLLTTLTTVAGLLPTAYGVAGYDSMLAEMMLAMAWGLMFGTFITLFLMPTIYTLLKLSGAYIRLRFSKILGVSVLLVNVLLLSGIFTKLFAQSYEIPFSSAAKSSLGLGEFIEQAYRSNLNFQELLIDEAKLVYAKNMQLPVRDIILEAASEYILVLDKQENDKFSGSLALSKLFPHYGTEISAEVTQNPSRTGTGTKTAYTLAVSQPVLNNAFGKTFRLRDRIVGLEVDIARYQIAEAYEDYLASLINLYYDWYMAYENLLLSQSALRDSQRLLENMKDRKRQRVAYSIDVDKASLDTLRKEEAFLDLFNRYTRLYNLVLQAINAENKKEYMPSYASFASAKDIDVPEEVVEATRESRTFAMLSLLEEQKKENLAVYADDLMPSTEVRAEYRRDEDGYLLSNIEKENLLLGVYLTKSFPDHKRKAYRQAAELDVKKTEVSIQNKKDSLWVELTNIRHDMNARKKYLELAAQKVTVAAAVAQEEKLYYDQGRSSLNDLLSAINALNGLRYEYLSHQVEWNKLTIEWLRLSDRLVSPQRGNLPFKKHPLDK